ncbi:hypothetical protein [Kitasatospora cheerisanensis]|uniref:hypothetical protein n=1 Tax=Kitasatospora cheerisanensis TaxID=81942 RepID=UPI0012EEB319|nr:hypothetical protein [Kitasatospora cheerisanensis]
MLGRAPLVHLPLLGADSAGKTMFLMAAVGGLRALAGPGVTVGFGTAEDRDRLSTRSANCGAGRG